MASNAPVFRPLARPTQIVDTFGASTGAWLTDGKLAATQSLTTSPSSALEIQVVESPVESRAMHVEQLPMAEAWLSNSAWPSQDMSELRVELVPSSAA